MCWLQIVNFACGHPSPNHTVTKMFCLNRLNQGVKCPQWERKYWTLEDSCGYCKREGQHQGKSFDGDAANNLYGGDAIDESSEVDAAESSNKFSDDEFMAKATLSEEHPQESKEEGKKYDVGDMAMSDIVASDGDEELSDEQLEKMVENVFAAAIKFPRRKLSRLRFRA